MLSLLTVKKVGVLIHIIKCGNQNDIEGFMKIGCLKTVIPAGQTGEVKCSVWMGPFPTKQEVLFEPEENPKWPEGLNITETVVCLQKGNRCKVHSTW